MKLKKLELQKYATIFCYIEGCRVAFKTQISV